jgi:hypothetical protein
MSEIVFLVNRVGGGAGVYSTGPQSNGLRGGPMAYVLRGDAEAVAKSVNGEVIKRTFSEVVQKCLEKGCTLFVRQPDGSTQYVEETAQYRCALDGAKLVPINPDGSERKDA